MMFLDRAAATPDAYPPDINREWLAEVFALLSGPPDMLIKHKGRLRAVKDGQFLYKDGVMFTCDYPQEETNDGI